MMKPGIFARTFGASNIADTCEASKRSGFELLHFNLSCVGLDSMPLEIPEDVIHLINSTLQSHNIEMCGISGTFNMCHPDPDVIEDGMQRFETLVKACGPMNIGFVSLCTGTRNPFDKWKYHPDNESKESWRLLLNSMERCLVVAEAHNVILGVEPETANVVSSIIKADTLLKELSSRYLKIIFDVANLYEGGSEGSILAIIETGLDVLGEHIQMIHVKDKAANGQFTTPGQGVIPFPFLVERLKENHKEVPLVAHGFDGSDAKNVRAYLQGIIGK